MKLKEERMERERKKIRYLWLARISCHWGEGGGVGKVRQRGRGGKKGERQKQSEPQRFEGREKKKKIFFPFLSLGVASHVFNLTESRFTNIKREKRLEE